MAEKDLLKQSMARDVVRVRSDIDLASRRKAKHLAPIKTSFSNTALNASTSSALTDSQNPNSEKLRSSVPSAKKSKLNSSVKEILNKPPTERSREHNELLSAPARLSSRFRDMPEERLANQSCSDGSVSDTHSRPQTATRPRTGAKPNLINNNLEDFDTLALYWQSMPFYQALSQAIMHTKLDVPAPPPSASLHTRISFYGDDETCSSNNRGSSIGRQMLNRIKSKTKLRSSASASQKTVSDSNYSWQRKTFALVERGILLQYSGDGSVDRLPENILCLGSSSTISVSHAIPSKRWVLQVVQASNENNVAANDSREILTFPSSSHPATTHSTGPSLLLIFDNAHNMESWMSMIRQEIENINNEQSSIKDTKYFQSPKKGIVNTQVSRSKDFDSPLGSSPLLKSAHAWSSVVDSTCSESETTAAASSNSESEVNTLLTQDTVAESVLEGPSVVSSTETIRQARDAGKSNRSARNQTFFDSTTSSISVPTRGAQPFVHCLPGLETAAFTFLDVDDSPPMRSQVPDFPLPEPIPLSSPVMSMKSWCGESTLGNIANDDELSDILPLDTERQRSLTLFEAVPDSPLIPQTFGMLESEVSENEDDAMNDMLPEHDSLERLTTESSTFTRNPSPVNLTFPQNHEASYSDEAKVDVLLDEVNGENSQNQSILERISEGDTQSQQGDTRARPSSSNELHPMKHASLLMSDSDSGVQMSSFRYSSMSYYARSSGYPSASTSGNTSRRTSTIISATPLPLRLSSRNSSSRNSTARQSTDFSNANTILTTASNFSSSPSNPLRRPVSIQVRHSTLPTLTSFALRTNNLAKQPTSAPGDPRVAGMRRSSTMMPLVRPPVQASNRCSVSWTSTPKVSPLPRSPALNTTES